MSSLGSRQIRQIAITLVPLKGGTDDLEIARIETGSEAACDGGRHTADNAGTKQLDHSACRVMMSKKCKDTFVEGVIPITSHHMTGSRNFENLRLWD